MKVDRNSTAAKPSNSAPKKPDADNIEAYAGELSLLFEALRHYSDRLINTFTAPGDGDLLLFPALVADKGDLLVDLLYAQVERTGGQDKKRGAKGGAA